MNTYVILAAGAGKRLWPLTESYPKPLVRVLGKSLLEWIVEGVLPDAERVVIVVGAGGEKVRAAFADHPYQEKIVFAEQDEPRGSGHALLQAEPHVERDFIVFNGDNFYDPLAFSHVASSAGYFAFAYPVKDKRPYGVFATDRGLLTGVVEKPSEAGPGLANLNLFRAPREFFELLKRLKPSPRGELEVTDALQAFARKNDVWANQLYTYWTDVGYFWNYLDANAYAAARLAPPAELGVVEGGVKLKGRVHIEPGAVVKSGATLEGPVWIGPGAEVGSGAVLRAGTVLEGGAWTGSAEISGSVLLRDAAVGDRCLVDQSVLAEGASLGEGSRVESVRGDSGPVQVLVNEKVVDSGRARLGACIGSGARLEAGVGVSPGILVGPNARVGPGYKVRDNLAKGEVLD